MWSLYHLWRLHKRNSRRIGGKSFCLRLKHGLVFCAREQPCSAIVLRAIGSIAHNRRALSEVCNRIVTANGYAFICEDSGLGCMCKSLQAAAKQELQQRQTKSRDGLKYTNSWDFLYQLIFGLMMRAASRLHQPPHGIVRLCYSAQSKMSSTTSSISSHTFDTSRDTLSFRPNFTPNLRRLTFLGWTTFCSLFRFAFLAAPAGFFAEVSTGRAAGALTGINLRLCKGAANALPACSVKRHSSSI